MDDEISKAAFKVITNADEPLETKEVEERVNRIVKDATRTKLFYRLNNLRAEGLIKGKFVGPGKGVWIWWKKEADTLKRR
jgi:repressor of nif and glnA expression